MQLLCFIYLKQCATQRGNKHAKYMVICKFSNLEYMEQAYTEAGVNYPSLNIVTMETSS